MTGTDLVGADEVAVMIGKHRATVVRLAHSGELPYAHKMPGKRGAFLFSRAVIDMYLRSIRGDAA